MNYFESLKQSMSNISNIKNSIFIGQSVIYSGNLIYKTLSHIPKNKKIELPVFEDVQMGMSIGLALEGFLPITCYPRFDFLLLGFNQMINHLDKIPLITEYRFQPKVIIRVMVGAKKPLDGGEQHTQDYSLYLKEHLKTIQVYQLFNSNDVMKCYNKAIKSKKSSLMIEYAEKI